MGYALNNVATADAYSKGATLSCPRTSRINVDVYNAAVYYQLGRNSTGSIEWDQVEFFQAPAFRSMDRICDAIRVRSATPGIPGRVTVHAIPLNEISPSA